MCVVETVCGVGIRCYAVQHDAVQHNDGEGMRRYYPAIVIVTTVVLGSAAIAADLKIPPRPATQDVSVHKGPPNCSRWTDECVNCSRGADGDAVCSNIGFACQPKAVRCLIPVIPHSELQQK
jgi:hypothetical protein